MYCGKCNGELKPNSKFCVFCGTPVNNSDQIIENNQVVSSDINNVPVNQVSVNNQVSEVVPQISQAPVIENNQVVENVQETNMPVSDLMPSNNQMNDVFVQPNNGMVQNEINNSNQVNVGQVNQDTINNQIDNSKVIPIVQTLPDSNLNNSKKGNKLPVIILGIILVLLAIFLFVFSFMKSSQSSIKVLEKALANMNKIESGATINLSIDAQSEGLNLNFSGTAKIQQKDNKTDMQIKLNKSILTDEINLYASILDYKATAYIESSVIDMLLGLEPLDKKWLYISEVIEVDDIKEETNFDNITLSSIIDEKNFIYIDEANGLKHYQLIIDKQLVDKLKVEVSKLKSEESQDLLESLESFTETLKIDFYINSNNELTKMSVDMAPYLKDSGISKLVLTIGFSDINKTTVEIPKEALDAKTDLETYINENTSNNENSEFGNTQQTIN